MFKGKFFLIKLGFSIGFPWIAITNIFSLLNITLYENFEQWFSGFFVLGVLLPIIWSIQYSFKVNKKENVKANDIFDDKFFKLLFIFLFIELIFAFIGINPQSTASM